VTLLIQALVVSKIIFTSCYDVSLENSNLYRFIESLCIVQCTYTSTVSYSKKKAFLIIFNRISGGLKWLIIGTCCRGPHHKETPHQEASVKIEDLFSFLLFFLEKRPFFEENTYFSENFKTFSCEKIVPRTRLTLIRHVQSTGCFGPMQQHNKILEKLNHIIIQINAFLFRLFTLVLLW